MAQKLLKSLKKTWQAPLWLFFALIIAFGSLSVITLRHNNQSMVKLRDAVYAADKNNGDVNAALNKLRDYVYTHMNTNLNSGGNTIKPPIQLKYTYQRLILAQQKQLESTNSQLYTDAENYCQQQDPTDFYGYYRVPCVQNYVGSHGLSTDTTNVPAALYEFDFVSPSWSPDLAGWSLAVTALLAFMTVIKLALRQPRKK